MSYDSIYPQFDEIPNSYVVPQTLMPKNYQLLMQLQVLFVNPAGGLISSQATAPTRQSIDAILGEAIAEIPNCKKDFENEFSSNKTKFKGYLDKIKTAIEAEIARNQGILDKQDKDSKEIAKQMDSSQNKNVESLIGNLPWIVAILCALFVGLIFIIRTFPPDIQIEWVASGQVIQLLTVVTLLLIILCLAVTHVILENTVGTLLGGIGGYVLSQGVGRAAAREASRNKQ